jgi:hypothetical protein
MKPIRVLLLAAVMALTDCAPETLLRVAVEDANMECPMEVDEMMTITSLTIEENNVVSTCMLNEDKSEHTVLQLDNPEAKNTLKAAFLTHFQTSENNQEMRELCKKAGFNVIYRFVGSKTGHTIDIVCQTDEL